ncbi:MAG: hypothetical protein JNK76_12180 [Planctomycetales bacterium]|nr:hypothetical protein [Planctomycetales bacterium]MBN8625169.1 hypothetical protein [Planctomycetota bacterium]
MAKAVSKRFGSAKSTASRKSPATKSAATKGSVAKKPGKKPAKKKSLGMMEKIVDMVGDVRKNMAKRRKARRAKIADAFSSLTGQSKGTKKAARRPRSK